MDTKRFIEADAHLEKPLWADLRMWFRFYMTGIEQTPCQFLQPRNTRVCREAGDGNGKKAAMLDR